MQIYNLFGKDFLKFHNSLTLVVGYLAAKLGKTVAVWAANYDGQGKLNVAEIKSTSPTNRERETIIYQQKDKFHGIGQTLKFTSNIFISDPT